MGFFEPAPAEESSDPTDERAASLRLLNTFVDVGTVSSTNRASRWIDGSSIVEEGGLDTAVRAVNFVLGGHSTQYVLRVGEGLMDVGLNGIEGGSGCFWVSSVERDSEVL